MNRANMGKSIPYSARKKPSQQSSKKKWWIALIAIAFLLTGGGVWAKYFRIDPRLAALQQMRQQLESENLSGEQRRAVWGQFREQADQLPNDLRRQLWDSGRPRFEAQMRKRMADFFALSAKDRIAELDKEIARQERRRKQREAGNNAGGGPPGPQAQAAGGTQTGQNGGGQGNRPNFANMSPEDRAAMRRNFLDNGSPELRAQMTEHRQLMNQRRHELGLPPTRGWGPRG